jgi:putative flavoprotein involved in K+ transport
VSRALRTTTTDTVVIGAGQAGLSLSRRLGAAGRPHVVLERGRIGERWRSERWESLAMLTPNWLNVLDGGPAHADADGFLGTADFVAYLRRYADANGSPVREGVEVLALERARGGFRLRTDTGELRAARVVLATGDSDVGRIPAVSATAPRALRQLHSSAYRSPSQLPGGGVLVVGSGPSGQQIAAELVRAGRHVVLATGTHTRMPRRYRGRDIWHWLDELGDLDRSVDELPDPTAARRAPSLALTGANGGEELDLGVLHRLGVTVAGRVAGFEAGRVAFSDDLDDTIAASERRMRVVLDRIDEHLERTGAEAPPARTVPAVRLPAGPASLDLAAHGVRSVIWATGYRRAYPWLHVPALGADGELVHRRGVTSVPGLFALGLRWQSRRASHFVSGVGADAAFVADRIAAADAPRAAARRSPARRPRPEPAPSFA